MQDRDFQAPCSREGERLRESSKSNQGRGSGSCPLQLPRANSEKVRSAAAHCIFFLQGPADPQLHPPPEPPHSSPTRLHPDLSYGNYYIVRILIISISPFRSITSAHQDCLSRLSSRSTVPTRTTSTSTCAFNPTSFKNARHRLSLRVDSP